MGEFPQLNNSIHSPPGSAKSVGSYRTSEMKIVATWQECDVSVGVIVASGVGGVR